MTELNGTLYGIKNCDTVKKARRWLDQQQIPYQFHDFRVDGLDQDQVEQWVQKLGWETLLNKRSTTWKGLPENDKQDIDEVRAVQLMLDNPTLIKRPVLVTDNPITGHTVNVGFQDSLYQSVFG